MQGFNETPTLEEFRAMLDRKGMAKLLRCGVAKVSRLIHAGLIHPCLNVGTKKRPVYLAPACAVVRAARRVGDELPVPVSGAARSGRKSSGDPAPRTRSKRHTG
jgi:hypothetical protein